MKKSILLLSALIITILLMNCSKSNTEADERDTTIVDLYGQLAIQAQNIVDQNGNIVVLRGMSLFWSNWAGNYYNKETIAWLRDDFKCTIVRAAIGVDVDGGYIESRSTELAKLYSVIDACIDLGIYVLVDWHSHHAEDHIPEAVEFFRTVSAKYGNVPNVIYEIYNEPLDLSWANTLKPYAEGIISIIRKNDPDNIIVVGTPNWSQDVNVVIGNRIDDANVVYSLHFYTGTHRQALRDKAYAAISAGIPLFVSEWGLSEADATGDIDLTETALWLSFIDLNDLSSCNWSVNNKDETTSILLPSTSTLAGWSAAELTEAGKFMKNYLIKKNSHIFDGIE